MQEEREILRKAAVFFAADGPISLKYKAIEKMSAHHAVSVLCRVLGVQRSGFYAWRRGPSAHDRRDVELTDTIRKIFVDSRCTYGAPRIRAELAFARGQNVGVHPSWVAYWPLSVASWYIPAKLDRAVHSGRFLGRRPVGARIVVRIEVVRRDRLPLRGVGRGVFFSVPRSEDRAGDRVSRLRSSHSQLPLRPRKAEQQGRIVDHARGSSVVTSLRRQQA